MKVIVTGSEGFLGTELCKWLSREHKCEVIRCDFALRGANHDITDKKTIAHLFTPDVDACVHLAAVSNLNYYSDDEKKSGDINVRGTRNVMDLCDQHKKAQRAFRNLSSEFAMRLSRRIMSIHTESAEQRYKKLLEDHPAIFQKAKLAHIASYLGITQQSLSRVRKNLTP